MKDISKLNKACNTCSFIKQKKSSKTNTSYGYCKSYGLILFCVQEDCDGYENYMISLRKDDR